jgi:hypothetical protein
MSIVHECRLRLREQVAGCDVALSLSLQDAGPCGFEIQIFAVGRGDEPGQLLIVKGLPPIVAPCLELVASSLGSVPRVRAAGVLGHMRIVRVDPSRRDLNRRGIEIRPHLEAVVHPFPQRSATGGEQGHAPPCCPSAARSDAQALGTEWSAHCSPRESASYSKAGRNGQEQAMARPRRVLAVLMLTARTTPPHAHRSRAPVDQKVLRESLSGHHQSVVSLAAQAMQL